MDDYARVWERFVADRRLEFGGHMDPNWSDGHSLSASLMIPVDTTRMRERLEPLREALGRFPFVSIPPDHFIHITLFLLGFLVPEPERKGEVSRERLAGIEEMARRGLSGLTPFNVELANLNAFPGAAFIEVHDRGEVGELRRVLRGFCDLEEPPGPPHLTIVYFQAPDGTRAPEELISAVERYRDWPVGSLMVESLALTLLDPRLDYPEPETLAEIPLGPRHQSPDRDVP